MYPDLISRGPLHVKTYGCCMALGFLAAWQVVAWLCRRTGRATEPLSNLLVALMIAGVVGSRVAYVIEHWQSEFAAHPLSVVRIDQGGLMFYGGLILALGCFFLWCRLKKERILPLADLLATVVPLGHAFGRVGCFFYGCCYGRESASALAVAFPRGSPAWYEQLNAGRIPSTATASLPVLPTQLFVAAAVLVLFVALFLLYRRFALVRPGLVTGAYVIGYALVRFGLEYLRGDPRAAVGPLSISQTISLGLLVGGFLLMAVAFFRKKG